MTAAGRKNIEGFSPLNYWKDLILYLLLSSWNHEIVLMKSYYCVYVVTI